MRTHALAIVALLALGTVDIAPAVAQGKPEKADQTAAPQRARSITLAPVTTDHRLALPGGTLDYRAVVETLPVVDDKGATTAQVAVIAYLAAAADPESRPVTFVFNGGPGVSSAFLQLGALGPKVLVTG
jgi:carboxypeptidase C (cathepsin A)